MARCLDVIPEASGKRPPQLRTRFTKPEAPAQQSEGLGINGSLHADRHLPVR